MIGAEVTLAHGSHLTLLAETQEGYANLSRLIAVGQLAGTKGAPVLTIEDVARHAGGLLCLSGCRQGAVAQAVLAGDERRAVRAAGKLAEIFGRDRLWIELQRHWLPDDDRLMRRAAGRGGGGGGRRGGHQQRPLRDGGWPPPARRPHRHPAQRPPRRAGPAPAPEQRVLPEGRGRDGRPVRRMPRSPGCHAAIAERCDVSLDFSRRRLPAFPPRSEAFPHGIPPGETAFSHLYALAQAGLTRQIPSGHAARPSNSSPTSWP